MKEKTQNLITRKAPSLALTCASLFLLSHSSLSQQGQPSLPGAGLKPGIPASAPASDENYVKDIMVGDYVELSDSLKNEMYGTIDFPDAELKQIVKAIAKLAKKNFILDKKIENRRITIISPVAVTKQEAYNAFLSALYMNDLTMVSEGKFLKIIDAKSAYQSNTRVFMGDYAPPSAEIVTVLYPLTHLNAEETFRFVQELVPRSGRVAAYPDTNTLVMTDTGLNLRRVISILKSIDIPGQSEQLESIMIRYASAKDISKLIDEILEAQNPTRSRTTVRRNTVKQKTRGGGVISKIVPDERTNSLVVLANGRGIMELKSLVNKLDTPNAAGGGNLHIYFCKHAQAAKISETLSKILTTQNRDNRNIPAPPTNVPVRRTAPTTANDAEGVQFEGNLKVTADESTNSLIVIGSASDYASLKRILDKLDAPRKQIYVEATIMEINVNNSKNIGVITNVHGGPGIPSAGGFTPGTHSGELKNFLADPSSLSGLVAGFGLGQRYRYEVGGVSFTLAKVSQLIRALVESSQAQVLHQPQILTSNNEKSEIKVTSRISTVSSTTTTGATTVTTPTVSKENVEIALTITPYIGEDSNLIKLDVEQQIDDFQPASQAGATGQIDTTQRKAKTIVTVRDGDTVVVGGLQKQVTSDLKSKLPILGDIPIIGRLFSGTKSSNTRSYLAIFLTPRVINEYNDLIKISQEKIDEREAIGRTASDPEDRLKSRIRELKKKVDSGEGDPERAKGFRPISESRSNESAFLSGDALTTDEPKPQLLDAQPAPILDDVPATPQAETLDLSMPNSLEGEE